jgi:lysophospholipase L1-like esterase
LRLRLSLPLLAFLLALSLSHQAVAAQNHDATWVGTWAAAPFAEPNKNNTFATDTTVREIVHVSIGGSAIRVILTNEFGTSDLRIGGANVALPTIPAPDGKPDGSIKPNTVLPVHFGGQPTITIAPGALAISDPIPLRLAAMSDLAVTLFIPGQAIDTVTYHAFADQTNFGADGNQLDAPTLTAPHTVHSWLFLKGIDVQGPAQGSIVCFGDSITDGAHSTADANRRWPDVLAARLQADKKTASLGVLNEGIGGNRVLHDVTGPSALARFDRDVLAHPDVRYLIILEGINDIGRLAKPHLPGDLITADDLIAGYNQLITRAHLHGIKVYGATLTPYGGAKYFSDTGEAVRQKVNAFIRTSGQFDGVIDFDKATLDPASPTRFLPASDSGDQLHPSDAGYKSMGDAIDLKLFTK